MVTFGGVSFPHVLNIQITSAHEEIERTVPGRTIAYRADKAELGRIVKIDGEIRETNIDTARAAIEQIRTMNDGVCRSLDLEDGTTPFGAQLANPEYELSVESWFSNADVVSGKFHIPYTLILFEVELP